MSAKINDSGRPATSTLEPSFDQPRLNWIANYIWGIADDVLRDLYLRGKYRDVILPMTVVRRQCEPHWACANSLPFVAAGHKASGPMDDRGQSERRCREDTGGSWGGLPGHEEAAAAASAARSARRIDQRPPYGHELHRLQEDIRSRKPSDPAEEVCDRDESEREGCDQGRRQRTDNHTERGKPEDDRQAANGDEIGGHTQYLLGSAR